MRTTSHRRRLPGVAAVALAAVAVSAAAITGMSATAANAAPLPKEFHGPKGPEPTRYGDWENKGIASDF